MKQLFLTLLVVDGSYLRSATIFLMQVMQLIEQSMARTAAATPGTGTQTVGALSVQVERTGDRNVARTLFQKAPLRALFPEEGTDTALAIVAANISGGIVGGDCLSTQVTVGPGSAVMLTGQAAEKVYRSTGKEALFSTELSGEKCRIEYLSQGTIVFDEARLRRTTSIDICGASTVLAGEITMLGRSAMGESFSSGALIENWRVCVDQKLVWMDSFRLVEEEPGVIERITKSSAGLDGARAMASIVCVGANMSQHIDAVRELLDTVDEDVCSGVTCVNGIMLFRLLSKSQQELRRAFGSLWASLRHLMDFGEPQLPRIWQV